ncbi:MAG: hypothetical protein QF450_02210, partial [Rhodospirillales bacterium]|nr:hypothetical protein [Rhodospirillales bacterium]
MSPTVIRIFLTLVLCVVLTISIYVMRLNVVGSVIGGVVFVVLVLGVWMVRSVGGDISKKMARTSPRQL